MIYILNEVPAIEECMLKAGQGDPREQLEFINMFVQLIGDVYTNAGCYLPEDPMFNTKKHTQNQPTVPCPRYCEYVTLIHKVRPHVDHVCRQGDLSFILRQITTLGLQNQKQACVKCNLIEFACMFDQEFHDSRKFEWVQVREGISVDADHGPRGVKFDVHHVFDFYLHWPEIDPGKSLHFYFTEDLQTPETDGWVYLSMLGKRSDEKYTQCLRSAILFKYIFGTLDRNHFRKTIRAFLDLAENRD